MVEFKLVNTADTGHIEALLLQGWTKKGEPQYGPTIWVQAMVKAS